MKLSSVLVLLAMVGLLDKIEHHTVANLEDVGILDAHTGEVVHVEEPPGRARLVVDIEEAAAELGVAPERVLLLVRGHVVWHDIEDDVEAGLAERPQLGGTAQLLRDVPRVDDVVAVVRAAACLQNRGEIQMADSEVAEVRDERAGVGKRQRRPQLQAIRRTRRWRGCAQRVSSTVFASRSTASVAVPRRSTSRDPRISIASSLGSSRRRAISSR